jgi:invasion protein IalB
MKNTAMGLVLFGLVAIVILPGAARALELKETYKDWAVYVSGQGGSKTCFAISRPKDMEPKNVNRGGVFFYVSSWPKDKIKNEISIKIGYPLDKDVAPSVTIGADQFTLFAEGDKAFIADETQERKLVEAMKKGATLVIKGRSKRGTVTTDKYSLSGISAALKRVSKECR